MQENVENSVLESCETDYSTPIILLVDLYYDLFQQSKLIDTANIDSSLLHIESRLHYLGTSYSKAIQTPSEDWCKNAMTFEGTPIWSFCYGYLYFHGCRSFLYRMQIYHKLFTDDSITIMDLKITEHSMDGKITNFQHHFDICCESADLITSFCRTLVKHGSNTKLLPTQFLMPLLQSTCIHILSAFLDTNMSESAKYRKTMKNVEINLKFMGWYLTKQAHNLSIFETMKNLSEDIFAIDRSEDINAIRMAFLIVYRTVNDLIPSLFSKNLTTNEVVEQVQ